MAQRKRLKLEYDWSVEEVARAFRGLGEDARDFLEHEVVYGEDPGRRALAREILGYASNKKEVQTKTKRNVEEE